MKNLRKILERLDTPNGLRGVAVVAAIAVWYAIRAATSNSAIVRDIPLTIQPPPDWSVADCSARTVDVAFLGTRNDMRFLNRELVKATIDVRGRADHRAFTVTLGAAHINAPGGARVDFIRPATVTLRLDRTITKAVPVQVETLNVLPDGYEIENTVVTPATVELTGPVQLLENIEAVRTAPVNLDGRVRSLVQSRLPLALDDAWAGVQAEPATVTLDLGIHERSVSTVFPDLAIRPMLPAGRAVRVQLEPAAATVTLKGRPDAMKALLPGDVRLFVDILDLTGSAPEKLPVRAVLPDGITLVSTEPAIVAVQVRE